MWFGMVLGWRLLGKGCQKPESDAYWFSKFRVYTGMHFILGS